MFSNYKSSLYLAISGLVFGLTSHVHAKINVDFNGFANLALTYSDDEHYKFRNSILNNGRSGLSLAPDSILGLQSSVEFTDEFEAIGQVILQDRSNAKFTNYLELAFLRYHFSRNLNVKVGRFSTNAYLLTDSRHVSYSFNWARVPFEMYSTAGSVGNINGAQINYTVATPLGRLKASAANGKIQFSDREVTEFEVDYTDVRAFSLELGSYDWRVQVAHVSTELDNLEFNGIDQIKALDTSLPPQLSVLIPFVDELQDNVLGDGKTITYTSIGALYNYNNFEFIAEYGFYDSDWALAQSSSYSYASISKTFGDFTGFLTFGEVDGKDFEKVINLDAAAMQLPPELVGQLAAISSPINASAIENLPDQNTLSIGLRWDFNINWALKFQFDHNVINNSSNGLFSVNDDVDRASLDGRVNVFNIGLSTTF